MKRTVFEIAAAVAAAAIGYLVFALTAELHAPWRWILVVLVAVVAFALATWAGAYRRKRSSPGSAVAIGEGIRAGKDIKISDIEAEGGADVRVGNKLNSKGSTDISGVRVRKRRK
jgi:membrane protein implicated in regulation of membrane protease activity